MEKKIATCVDVRINVGNYQHIEITKYAEQNISYESEKEMIFKEDELTNGLVSDIIRTMKSIPDKLGKKTNAVEELEEAVKKEIPRWLTEGVEPNLALSKANLAEKNHQTIISDKKSEIDNSKKAASTNIEDTIGQDVSQDSTKKPKATKPLVDDDMDIFGGSSDDKGLF